MRHVIKGSAPRLRAVQSFSVNKSCWYLAVTLAGLAALAHGEAGQSRVCVDSKWDRCLPSLVLTDVDVKGDSLSTAWQKATSRFGLRVNLFLENTESIHRPFAYSAERCLAGELFDALASTYGYTWTQDPKTGVIWMYPASYEYEDVLAQPVSIRRDLWGVPMLTFVLEELNRYRSAGRKSSEFRVDIDGTFIQNTYNCEMDLPRGDYTVRDLLNICSVANAAFEFHAMEEYGDVYIKTNMIVCDNPPWPTVGALAFWKAEIGPWRSDVPSKNEITARLSDDDARIRWAARVYCEFIFWRLNAERWVTKADLEPAEAVWVSYAILSLFVRCEDAGFPEAVARLRQEATESFLMTADPRAALLCAMELARMTDDTSALKVLAERKLTPGELHGMESEVGRVAYVCPIAAAALLSPDTKDGNGESLYIDTGGWAQEVLVDPEALSQELHFSSVGAPKAKVADAASPVAHVAGTSTDKAIAAPPVASGPGEKPQESDKDDSAATDVVSSDVPAPEPKSSHLVPVLILIAAIALATTTVSLYRRHAK